MPKNSPSVRSAGSVAARVATTLGPGAALGGGALSGHPVAGVAVAAAIVAVYGVPVVTASLIALIVLFRKDGKDAVKLIEAFDGSDRQAALSRPLE